MEILKRKIRLFFLTYGSFLFRIIALIVIVILVLQGINYLYKKNTEYDTKQAMMATEQTKQQSAALQGLKEDEQLISSFLDYCNNKEIQKAYEMLSKECINEKYPTIEKFKQEYIDKIFSYPKEYEIEKENDEYKITIIEGALQSGTIENRNSIESYYKIKEDVLIRSIYIER